MEDVLSVYQRDFAADTVLVVMNATLKQQTKATRTPLAVRSGQPAIDDVEYERNGTANLFMVCAPLVGWRQVKVTDRRTRQDFAELLQDLVADYFPNKKIVLVMDNLNTHKLSVLYNRYEPAARIARQIAVHQTPKPGSWLHIAAIEINVLSKHCLARRLPDRETMVREVAAWQNRRNEATKSVD